MLGQEHFVEAVEGGVDSGYLDEDIRTVQVVLHHFFDAPHLPFNPVQAVEHIPPLFFRALLCFVLTGGTGSVFFHASIHSFQTPVGYYYLHV